MEKLTKPKLKTKWSEAPLIWQSKYEFDAPYNFEECIRRINAFGTKNWNENQELWTLFFPSYTFGIDSQQDNGGVFNFKISGSASKVMFDAALRGQLIYESDNQSKVKVRVGFKLWSVAFLLALFPLACILILAPSGDLSSGLWVIGVCVFGLVLLMQLWLGYVLKFQLRYDIQDALTKPSSTEQPPVTS